MSTNEVLGDSATHFFKTGNVLRNKDDDLVRIRELIPESHINQTFVEYDIWYDMNDPDRVHGYMYTDVMSKFIYLRVGDYNRNLNIMKKASSESITEDGEYILNDLAENNIDKYKLRKPRSKYDFVIFLPGANILQQAVDIPKVKHAVSQGAVVKCHPLTSRDLKALLIKEFGEENVVDKKFSGHDLMNDASIIGCAENSEMGLVALAKNKTVYRFGTGSNQLTYSAIYNAVWERNGIPNREKLAAILSAKYSGLVPAIASNPKDYINSFFDYYKDIPHVKPKSLNT